MLTPLAVGPGRPFPYISNLSLSLAVWLRDPVSGTETFARVKVPKEVLPRFVPIARRRVRAARERSSRATSTSSSRAWRSCATTIFRVTRDADFTVSDEADDLLRAVEDELRRRRFGEVVRLEVSSSMDPDMRAYLVEQLGIEETPGRSTSTACSTSRTCGRSTRSRATASCATRPGRPVTQPAFADAEHGKADVLAAMRAGDLLVHHPYDSFAASVERFIQQAVADPDVLAIKMTVYRTSDDSALVPSLIEAAERGKQAVCLVELKARFDERRNIGWARSLEEAGAHVVHGLPGLKTHAKALLVVRREGAGVRHYVHIGTGNYHAKTARLYEDFGLFTTDRDDRRRRGGAVQLAHRAPRARRLPQGRSSRPSTCATGSSTRCERTIEAHEAGEDARIVLKLNSLVDARCIRALYEASQAGVRGGRERARDLLPARRACRACPRTSAWSRSSGRFLEHSRLYGFRRGDERRYWMGSADLMPRNLDTRVELLVPVERPAAARTSSRTRSSAASPTTPSPGSCARTSHGSAARGGTRSVHRELMERALERPAEAAERCRQPRRRFSASTRAASRARARGTRASAGPEPAAAGRPRSSWRSRSSGPGRRPRARSARRPSPRPERSSTAWASMLSVIATPSKPSCRRSSSVATRGDCDAIRFGSSAG